MPRNSRSGGIGRRDGFKIRFPQGSGGSSPPSGTNLADPAGDCGGIAISLRPDGTVATIGANMGRRTRTYDEDAVRGALLDHAFRATLHRLRGVQALLVGWAEIGVVGEEAQRVRVHHEDATRLLARVEWLHGARARDLPLERLVTGESPQVLLAAAACHATPEEAHAVLPQVVDPEAALALALWSEAQRPEGEPAELRFQWEGGTLELRMENAVPCDLQTWHDRWGRFVVEQTEGAVRFRPGGFRPAADVSRTAVDDREV